MFRWCMRARKVKRSVLHANMTFHEQHHRHRSGADSGLAPVTIDSVARLRRSAVDYTPSPTLIEKQPFTPVYTDSCVGSLWGV